MCLDECCYWYSQFPATPPSCNRGTMTTTVLLPCEIWYLVRDNTTNVEVKWFKSESEPTAGIKGERLHHNTNPMYHTVNITIATNFLEIKSFTASHIGYYWCQIVINNNTYLPPSPYGYIYSPDCILQDVTCNRQHFPLCAHTFTSQQMAHTLNDGRNCSLEDSDNNITHCDSRRTTVSPTNFSTVAYTTMHISSSKISDSIPTRIQEDIYTTDDATTKINVSAKITSDTMTVTMSTSTIFYPGSTFECNFSSSGYLCSIGVILGVILVTIVCLLVLSITFFYYKRRKKIGKSKNIYN